MCRNRFFAGLALLPLMASAACAIAPDATTQQQSSPLVAPDGTATAATAAPAAAADGGADAEPARNCEEPGRYLTSGGTVTDLEEGDTRGLVWQAAPDGTLRTQEEATAYCAALSIDGAGGFRLPSSHELQSLLLKPGGLKGGPGYCMPAIDQTAFPSTLSDGFWSATDRPTASELDAVEGYEVGFDDGRTHPSDPSDTFYVRCVQ